MTRAVAPDPRIAGYRAYSEQASFHAAWFVIVCLALLLLLQLPDDPLRPGVIALSAIGVWRWSWGAMHLIRARHYRSRVYPQLKAAAENAALPPAVFVIVTSYRMEPGINSAVYGALFAELARMGKACCVVAAVTDPGDAQVLETAFLRQKMPEGATLRLVFQDGTGKRSAMVEALKVVQSMGPAGNTQLVLMDGDTLINPGDLEQTCRFMSAFPHLGAVTTNNQPLVQGGDLTREWYRLRMAQRDVQMCSMALSGKLLVLTGRFSVFRMQVAMGTGFALALANDSLNHWRLGRIRMVTGDDKSTWFYTLSTGWGMAYLPDVTVNCLEELPSGTWWQATTGLMRRWYGNMSRNNGRAIALGYKRLGVFPWLCLVDQRIAPWTTMFGPCVIAASAASGEHSILAAYALWVLGTRTLVSALDSTISKRRFHPAFPFLLYYSQIIGAVIKIQSMHFPDRQGWNRQKLAATTGMGFNQALSRAYLALSIMVFLLLAGYISTGLGPQTDNGPAVGFAALLNEPAPDATELN